MTATTRLLVPLCLPAVLLAGEPVLSVSFERQQDQVHVLFDGRPFTTFHFASRWDKPFLHPIRTASGAVISRGFPLEPQPGDSTDHPWHRGIWYGHADINGEDFWRELGAEKTSRLISAAGPSYSASRQKGTLRVSLSLETPRKLLLGSVRQTYTFSKSGPHPVIDATIEILADRGRPLTFGDTDDGGFGLRLADSFRQDRGAALVNSDGLRDTENIWGKPARWVDYSAVLGGRKTGVTLMDHPTNFRHPTTWHARGYGLCSANPFALRSFTGDKSKDGAHTISTGDRLVFRYRVLIHEGDFDTRDIERRYAEFTEP